MLPVLWYRTLSLPGQFAPRSESANKNLANSLPGHFAPWPFRSLAHSLPGNFAHWNFRSLERNGLALSLPGTKILANFCSLELSLLSKAGWICSAGSSGRAIKRLYVAYRIVMFWINGGKVPGTKVPGSESSQELSFPGAKGPAISLQGANGPGSERARERFGQSPIGRFAPGSELARERKGCEYCIIMFISHAQCHVSVRDSS